MSIERQMMRKRLAAASRRRRKQLLASETAVVQPKQQQQQKRVLSSEKNSEPPIDSKYIVKDSTIVCIASGPSLTQEQIDIIGEAKQTNDKLLVVAVNDNWQWKYQNEFISDHLYAADTEWWLKYINEINSSGFPGIKWVPIRGEFAKKHGLVKVNCKPDKGLGIKQLHCHHNSGAQAIGMAFFLGAKKIILIGYDMKSASNGKNHWFGNHPKGLRNTPQKYQHWIGAHKILNHDLAEHGVEVVNCTLDTAIPHYRCGDLAKELIISRDKEAGPFPA